MKKTISESGFIQAFKDYNREDNFSHEGLCALFDWLEDYDENYDLDVIALCCEFSEYTSLAAFQADYGDKYDTIADIEASTIVIPINGGSFIIQSF